MIDPPRPTQSDVAKLAGVSQATISYVLNGHGRVSTETRLKVQSAIETLNYAASPAARILAGGASSIWGVFAFEAIFHRDGIGFYQPFLSAIEAAAEERGADLLVLASDRQGNAGRRDIHRALSRLRMADGCILLGKPDKRSDISELATGGFPIVFVGRRENAFGLPWVAANYASATRSVYEWMMEAGHQRIAYVGPPRHEESATDRLSGFAQAGGSPNLIFDSTQLDERSIVSQLQQAEATGLLVEPTAMPRLLASMGSSGIRIPEDISVARLGDPTDTYAPSDHLQWSGFTIPREEMGAEACNLLQQWISTRVTPDSQGLDCILVRGETIRPA